MRTWVAAVVLVTAAATSGCGGASGSTAADGSFGALPSFLPSGAAVDAELVGKVSHPALTTEGDSVKASLAKGSVLITVSGPVVPGEGLPNPPASTTCTWTVTMSGATTAVPVDASTFNAIDHLGKVYKPAFVAGQPKPPKTLQPGRSVTFELRVIMATGEGLMRWAPDGKNILASWDFVVEND